MGSALPTAALLDTKTKDPFLGNKGEYFEYQFWFPDAKGANERVLLFDPIANDPKPLYILTLCVCWEVFTSYCSQSVSSILVFV